VVFILLITVITITILGITTHGTTIHGTTIHGIVLGDIVHGITILGITIPGDITHIMDGAVITIMAITLGIMIISKIKITMKVTEDQEISPLLTVAVAQVHLHEQEKELVHKVGLRLNRAKHKAEEVL